jgi:hypothetical protein
VGIKIFSGVVAREPRFIGKTTCYHLLPALICFSSWERIRNLLRRLLGPPLQGKVQIYLLDHIFLPQATITPATKKKVIAHTSSPIYIMSTSNERNLLEVDKDKEGTSDLSNSISDEIMVS